MKPFGWAILLGAALSALSFGGEARVFRIRGPVAVSFTTCSTDGYVTWTNAPTNTILTVQAARSLAGASNWVDFVQVPVTNSTTTYRLFDPKPPDGMVFIPAGSFKMGDVLNDCVVSDMPLSEHPVHDDYVSAFYMDRYEVTKALWDEVRQWALTNGYDFTFLGYGKDSNHPVHTLNWYDMVKWCNARSEKEGLIPAYYTNAAQAAVYRSGWVDPANDSVNWNAGYRLPTEAEWEKAARGGKTGQRFPWLTTDTITHSQANYYATNRYAYDISPTFGFHPAYVTGEFPYTSPVGSFDANEYGLYDMAGNMLERCWDWYDPYYYSSSPDVDPRGPVAPPAGPVVFRALRGGYWYSSAYQARCSYRANAPANVGAASYGFRCVRGR